MLLDAMISMRQPVDQLLLVVGQPAAALLSATILIAGQTLFERLFGFAATLSIVIEALGGIAFLYLLLFRKRS